MSIALKSSALPYKEKAFKFHLKVDSRHLSLCCPAFTKCIEEKVNGPNVNSFSCLLQGLPRLVQALSKLYSPHLGREVDPMSEILISVGAYGSLYCTIQGLINPGDEVCHLFISSSNQVKRPKCFAQ